MKVAENDPDVTSRFLAAIRLTGHEELRQKVFFKTATNTIWGESADIITREEATKLLTDQDALRDIIELGRIKPACYEATSSRGWIDLCKIARERLEELGA